VPIDLAWKNVLVSRRRTLLAILGIGFSVLLMFMQIGFLRGVQYNVTILYGSFAGELVIASSKYISLQNTAAFDRVRLAQARQVAGVAEVAAWDLATLEWKDKATKVKRGCIVIAAPGDPDFVENAGIRAGWLTLRRAGTVLVDKLSDPAFGPVQPGTIAEINGQDVTVAGNYHMGLGLYAKGAVVTSAATFAGLTGRDPREVAFGLVRLLPGADRAAVAEAIRRALPPDVLVLEQDRMMRAEQESYFNSKPVGVIFRVGALVSFIVGMVIFYQILSTETINHLREYATLKALGFGDLQVYLVGIRQALLYAAASYAGSALLSAALFRLISQRARMELRLDLTLAAVVLAFTLFMCGVAAALALRRVRTADPAELF
jgi:putative ABC transport system permease protein